MSVFRSRQFTASILWVSSDQYNPLIIYVGIFSSIESTDNSLWVFIYQYNPLLLSCGCVHHTHTNYQNPASVFRPIPCTRNRVLFSSDHYYPLTLKLYSDQIIENATLIINCLNIQYLHKRKLDLRYFKWGITAIMP